jgi:hypothetical protein
LARRKPGSEPRRHRPRSGEAALSASIDCTRTSPSTRNRNRNHKPAARLVPQGMTLRLNIGQTTITLGLIYLAGDDLAPDVHHAIVKAQALIF